MEQLQEWCFEFSVTSGSCEVKHRALADELLMAAVSWAEQRDYGIGGGFDVVATPTGTVSDYRFGLMATLDDQLIPAEDAEALFQFLQATAKELGLEMKGGWRPYSEDDY